MFSNNINVFRERTSKLKQKGFDFKGWCCYLSYLSFFFLQESFFKEKRRENKYSETFKSYLYNNQQESTAIEARSKPFNSFLKFLRSLSHNTYNKNKKTKSCLHQFFYYYSVI